MTEVVDLRDKDLVCRNVQAKSVTIRGQRGEIEIGMDANDDPTIVIYGSDGRVGYLSFDDLEELSFSLQPRPENIIAVSVEADDQLLNNESRVQLIEHLARLAASWLRYRGINVNSIGEAKSCTV